MKYHLHKQETYVIYLQYHVCFKALSVVAGVISPLTYLGYFNSEAPYDSILKSGYGFSTPDDGSGILGHFIIMVYASSKAVIKFGVGGNCKFRVSDLNGEWSEWKLL